VPKDARYDDRNRGALFKNSKKETDRDPDYTGHLDVGGVGHWISGWINTSKAGAKFMALSVRPKDLTNDKPKTKQGAEAQADATFGIG